MDDDWKDEEFEMLLTGRSPEMNQWIEEQERLGASMTWNVDISNARRQFFYDMIYN